MLGRAGTLGRQRNLICDPWPVAGQGGHAGLSPCAVHCI